MTPLETVILSDTVTFFLSLGVSVISFAVKWGALREDVRQLESNMATKQEVAALSTTLAEIKGMFVLKLRE
jgi:cell division protein FtsL